MSCFQWVVALLMVAAVSTVAADVAVAGPAELRAAVAAAKPGIRLLLAGGDYGAGYRFADLRGELGRPIVIAAADSKNPPVFSGGNVGIHLSNPAYVELHGLVITRMAQNGLNLDDGAAAAQPESARGIVLRGLRVSDIGAEGNNDGLKLSGLWDFRVEDCVIERWGTKGGSAIDMVGCHRGVISGCTIRHNNPEPPNCTGVQAKGGSSEIAILGNRFEHAGGRSINIGGSTGRPYFRPALGSGNEHVEARAIRVEGNTFLGSIAAVAFVGVDGAVVRYNTIERPARWAVRILQENRAADFVACRRGEFMDNVIVFESTRWSEGGVNIGAGVAADTFIFARNWWYCADAPARSAPRLPVAETGGVHGRAPEEARAVAGAAAWRGR